MDSESAIEPSRGIDFEIGVSDFSSSEPLANAETIIAAGIDFIEPGLAKIAALTDSEFHSVAQRLQQQKIAVRSVNWFLPGHLKVTGPQVDSSQSTAFLHCALPRAVKLGAKAIVFGSPDSRTVPDGFPMQRAREQMIEFCHLCSDLIQRNAWPITIAIEHVNHTETNFVNTFEAALALVNEVNRPEIGLAADFYHFAMENEALEIMMQAPGRIHAVQLADPEGRGFPKHQCEIAGIRRFLQILSAIEYCGGVSIEANVVDLKYDCQSAVRFFKELALS